MSEYSYSSELYLSELMRISSNIVWKDPRYAVNDDSTVMIEVEQYMLAVKGQLTFDLIYRFDLEPLVSAGFTEMEADMFMDEPEYIPEDRRDLVTKNQVAYIIEHYEEQNDYYRMLNGLPCIDDTDFIYNTRYPDIGDPNVPIHLLPINDLFQLESNGYLKVLQEEHPDKKYLYHMTSKKIDPFTARETPDFGLLYVPESTYTRLSSEFVDTYNACRHMITSSYNIKNVMTNNAEAAGFIGMMILFYTINQMHYKFLDADMTREFYDEESLKYVYDTYGIPYYPNMSNKYHQKIVNNVNTLISSKGSNEALEALFEIFDLLSMDIYNYYLYKYHKFEDGKPVFVKKEDGSYDYEKMYDITFVQIGTKESIMDSLMDETKYVSYKTFVRQDPYWIDDEALRKKLYESEYNYTNTKYIGMKTQLDLLKIVYEYSYFFKFVLDEREGLSKLRFYDNTIEDTVTIFDLIMYLCALVSEYYGYSGNIPSEPHVIGKVMGYDVKADLQKIKDKVLSTPSIQDDSEILEYLASLDVMDLNSIGKIYSNIYNFRKFLIRRMHEAPDTESYFAYYEIYNTLMYSEYITDNFKRSDGTPYESYLDYLADMNPKLYIRLKSEVEDYSEEISHVLYMIDTSCKVGFEYFDGLEYIKYAD